MQALSATPPRSGQEVLFGLCSLSTTLSLDIHWVPWRAFANIERKRSALIEFGCSLWGLVMVIVTALM